MWVINLKKQFVNEDHGICHVVLLHEISEMHPSLADRTLIPMCGAGSFPLGLVLVPPTTCPGRAVVLCPSRALGRWCLVTQGGYCVPRLLPWLLHNLLLLRWNVMCLMYRGWLLSLGIQLTFFSSFYYFSVAFHFPSATVYRPSTFHEKYRSPSDCVQVLGKNISAYKKKGIREQFHKQQL